MRVVIAGQKWLAAEILAACIARSYDILLAVTNPAGSFAKAAAAYWTKWRLKSAVSLML